MTGITMTEYVLGFAFGAHNQVLLIEKNKPDWQKGKLNGVGGKVEETDTSDVFAMMREVEEETGITTTEQQWTHACTMDGHGKSPWLVQVFKCETVLAFAKNMTDEKVGIYKSFDLPVNVIPNLRWLIPLCLDKEVTFPVIVHH